MPKSGFDPAKHQRKLHRHNPLSKSTSSSSAASSPATSSTINATLHTLQQASKATDSFASNDIIPLLANLPELNSSSSSSSSNNALPPTINLADKVWSLASVSLLLSTTPTQTASEVKSNRKLLLSHNLVGRLLAALSTHTEVDVRREASGALRNLCVDAGIDVRNQVINKGGVDIILSAMRWASNALGFDGAPSATPTNSFVDDAPTLEQDIQAKRQLLSKPLEKLNKKEKRHLTKLANTLGKTLELIAGRGLSPEDEHKLLSSSSSSSSTSFSNTAEHAMDTATTTTHTTRSSNRAEPFLSLDSNTRKGLIEMAENLVTLVWCLCESGDKAFAKLVSFRWLDADLVRGAVATGSELNAEGLASWLSSAIALGSRAANLLSTAAPDGSRSSNVSHRHESLGALTNEELSLLLDLALASGNALCALTDGGESVFINGFLSRNTLPTPSSIKDGSKTSFSKKKAGKLELQKQTTISAPPPPITLAQQPLAATNRLACIGRAISLLQACVETDESKIDKLKRYVLSQTTMLGVLSAGVLRNLASAVDSNPNVATATSTFSSRRRRHDDSNSLTSKNVFIPTHNGGGNANANANAEEGGMSLKKYEETVMLPTLTKLLARVEMTKLAHDLDGRADVSEAMLVSVSVDGDGGKDVDEAVLKMKLKGKAEEKAQTLMLALEILAELGAAGLDNDFISGLNDGQDGDDDEWLEDFDAPLGNDDEDDDDGEEREEEERVVVDEDMDDECESTLNGGEKMNDDHTNQDMMMAAERGDTFAEAVKRNTCLPFQAYAPILASLFASPTFTHALLTLARPFEASFPSLSSSPQQPSNDGSSSSSSTTAAAALLRGLHLRSLSVLNNVLLRLAAYSPPPPSQPATNPKQQRRIAAFRAWVTSEPQRSILLDGVWKSGFEIAKGCASVPAVALAGSAIIFAKEGGGGGGGGQIHGSSGGAGGEGEGEGKDGLIMVETCIGNMWSVARCLEANVPLFTTASCAGVELEDEKGEVICALTNGYGSAVTDGMRVKSILLLSTIARSSCIHASMNAFIGNFLVSILENIPETTRNDNNGKVSTTTTTTTMTMTTTAESMVAAINGIIDTYADESLHYDQVGFRDAGLLQRLRQVVFRCKSVAKRVDRRKQISLRETAEEAVQNLIAFIEYRNTLGF